MPKVARAPKFRNAAFAGTSAATKATSSPSSPSPSMPNVTEANATKSNSTCKNDSSSPLTRDTATEKTRDPSMMSNITKSSATDPQYLQQLSRGQKRRQAKRDQYLRKERMILSSLKLKHDEDQKKRIDGLDAIRNALLATVKNNTTTDNDNEDAQGHDDSKATNNLLKSNKSKKLLVQKEAAQMGLVLQHPVFQEDPFGAIRQHLTNTLSTKDVMAKQKKEAIKHVKDRAQKEEEKRVRRKEHAVKTKRKKFKATRSKAR